MLNRAGFKFDINYAPYPQPLNIYLSGGEVIVMNDYVHNQQGIL